MNKIWIIIQREYITRVRNKTFLLTTFLLPIVMMLFFVGIGVLAAKSNKESKKIAIVNGPEYLKNSMPKDAVKLSFVFAPNVDTINFSTQGFDAVLDFGKSVDNRNLVIHSSKQVDIETMSDIEDILNKAYENNELQKKGIQKTVLDSINKLSRDVFSIDNTIIGKKGKSSKINAGINYLIGICSGLLIYITLLVFGSMVMRGVMEEKTNRIAEVVVSSVKPFQLMMGKILGIAAVGLTQLLLWVILMSVLSTIASMFIPSDVIQQAADTQKTIQPGMAAANTSKFGELMGNFSNVNWSLILGCFTFYFLGGYLFYASLFAAIGSVVNENPQESQSLMFPITMPIIFAFFILMSNVNSPDSPIMKWASMIPFTSPIVMMGRIPSGGVPWYQLLASMALLVAGFIFTTWMAGRIYRTGILLYGKKASWKEMFKWAFSKQ